MFVHAKPPLLSSLDTHSLQEDGPSWHQGSLRLVPLRLEIGCLSGLGGASPGGRDECVLGEGSGLFCTHARRCFGAAGREARVVAVVVIGVPGAVVDEGLLPRAGVAARTPFLAAPPVHLQTSYLGFWHRMRGGDEFYVHFGSRA